MLLPNRLSSSLPPKLLNYSDYLINFELFYRSIDDLEILYGDNLDFIKNRIKNAALMSFRNYNANVPEHFSNEEFEAFNPPVPGVPFQNPLETSENHRFSVVFRGYKKEAPGVMG